MKYLKLELNWGPGGERAHWGNHVDYFEIGPGGYAVRQVNAHLSGPTLKYDTGHTADEFGFLADQPFPQGPYPLEEGDGQALEITAVEFDDVWARTEALNRR